LKKLLQFWYGLHNNKIESQLPFATAATRAAKTVAKQNTITAGGRAVSERHVRSGMPKIVGRLRRSQKRKNTNISSGLLMN
jgi:hypothetical protein